MTHLARLALLVLPLALLGCGGSTAGARNAVSGHVTLKGAAVDQGTIQFWAKAPMGPERVVGGAMIKNGSYELPATQGLEAGTYRVVISSLEPGVEVTPDEYAAGKRPTPGMERIPAEYGEASTQTVEVKEGQNTFDFKIP